MSRFRDDCVSCWSAILEAVQKLTAHVCHAHTIILFKKLTYLWLACNLILLLPIAPHLWGPKAYILPLEAGPSPFGAMFSLMTHPVVAPYWPIFVIGQAAALALGLSGRFPRLAAIAVFFFTKNLSHKAWVILNGGHNLIEIMLLYQIFMVPSQTPGPPTCTRVVNNVATNLSFYAARLQLVLVYCVAGLAKLGGGLWPHGVALYYVLTTDEYTHPMAQTLVTSDTLVTLGTYGTVAFMLTFPTLIWLRKTRVLLLFVGIILHLNIAVLMGLVDFGTAMITCYSVMLTEK